MLPTLSKLSLGDVCRPCTTTPTDAELSRWDMREEELDDAELARIPPNVNDSRTECSICFEPLREPVDGSRAVIVAVDSVGSCGHAFHKTCLQRWFDGQVRSAGALTCPLCRQPFLDRKIDELYQRVNGERPAPAPRPPRAPERRPPHNPIAEYPTLWEGPYGWVLLLSRVPDEVRIPIPNERRADWTEYTRGVFCRKFGVDPERLTLEVWTNILVQSESRQNWWLSYHRLVAELRSIATDAPRAAVAVANSARTLVRDVKEARAEGATWSEVVLALVVGD